MLYPDYKKEDYHDAGDFCGDEECQECCIHEEKDHGICMMCEKDCNDGSDIDAAQARMEDR
jgi:hypothetical protein